VKQPIISVARQWRRPWGDSSHRRPSVDPETGLRRAAALREAAEAELARAARFGRPLAVLTIALQLPAPPSRHALQRFAAALRHQTRGFDLVGRADDGGFFVLLPEATRPEAMAVAQRIHQQAAACFGGGAAPAGPGRPALVRVGVATFPQQGMLLDELLTAARTSLAAPEPAPPAEEAAPRAALDAAWRLNRFVAIVTLSGLCVLAASLPFISAALLAQLAPFIVLGVLAERLTNLKYDRISLSLSGVAVLAAGAFGGPAAGALVGCINGLASWRFSGHPPQKGLFNTGNITLSGAASGLPYWWLGGIPALSASPLVLVPGLVAGVLCFTANMVLLAEVVALATGSDWRTEWRLRCNWLAGHYAIMGALSLGLALLYAQYGLTGLLLLLGPIGVLYYAQRQYVSHTATHVAELSSLNQELTASNQRLTEMNARLEHTLGDLRLANESMLTALCEALELRDRETEGHSQRVVRYARATAIALGLAPDDVQAVVHGAHLHDIGKIGVADAILRKPGPLTPEEWIEMKKHPEIGYRMIAHIPFLGPASLLVRHHHERWDGRGYPDGLAGEAIPLGARIFAVVDAFDAMTSDRPYRAALSCAAALAELERGSATQFDPEVVAVFSQLVISGAVAVQPDQPDQPAVPAELVERRGLSQRRGAALTTAVSAS